MPCLLNYRKAIYHTCEILLCLRYIAWILDNDSMTENTYVHGFTGGWHRVLVFLLYIKDLMNFILFLQGKRVNRVKSVRLGLVFDVISTK